MRGAIPVLLLALGLPLAALYVMGVALTVDMDSAPGQYALILPISYLLGAIPWSFMMACGAGKGDITRYRAQGSHAIHQGMSIPVVGMAVLLEMSKGALSVALAWAVADTSEAMVVAGLLATTGHSWPVFLKFKGGTGVSCLLGGLLVIEPIASLVGGGAFFAGKLHSRSSSLSPLAVLLASFVTALVLTTTGASPVVHLYYIAAGAGLVLVRLFYSDQAPWRRKELPLQEVQGDTVEEEWARISGEEEATGR